MSTGDEITTATLPPAASASDVPIPKKIVVCLDGTGNQIGSSQPTNVAKIYQMLDLLNPKVQIAFYDPGVGTLPASTARGKVGRIRSLATQLAFGSGLQTNLTEAYTWLMHHYQPGDKIYIFGFSRGAYTARALTGMLTRPGLLRPGSENLVAYAVGEYVNNRKIDEKVKKGIQNFADAFCWGTEKVPLFPEWPPPADYHEDWHCVPVEYLGVWDTVKATGFLRFGNLQWPFTRNLRNVRRVRHAVSIDERRLPYREYLATPSTHVEEVWFAGVHSDVGGTFDDAEDLPLLSTIPLKWIADGVSTELSLRDEAYQRYCTVTEDHALSQIHRMGRWWALAGIRHRPRPATAILHASVATRRKKYPAYPSKTSTGQQWADTDWTNPTV
jgi:uncharacterized protein (DUF2235 family)